MNKEQIYDTEIAPLMTQIINICQQHGIAMLLSFAIPTQDDPSLACTTLLPDENNVNAPGHKEALRLLRNEVEAMHLRTTHADGSTTLTAIL